MRLGWFMIIKFEPLPGFQSGYYLSLGIEAVALTTGQSQLSF